ncbi:unnamed protein product [Auanema sp. JU1783]|nr:unnamed protein product [Auanema sp. JU1783]
MGPSFGGGCGCPQPMCAPRPMCAPPPMPICPPPPPCPPQFCPPPPICPPPPPPIQCPPPLPPPPPPPPPPCACSQAPQPMFYQPQPMYTPYVGGCGGAAMMPRLPAQNDCCCGCSSPCRYKSRRRAAAFGSKTVDPSCNSSQLKQIIEDNILPDASESKRAIQTIAEAQLGHMVNVICGKGEFSYLAHTEQFCQQSKDDVTCYVFKPL